MPAAVLAAVAATAGLFAFGYLLAGIPARRLTLDRVHRLALALPALLTWSLALMVLHVVTGGWVFATPWAVRGLTIAAAVGAAILELRRGGGERAPRADLLVALAMVGLGLIVWGSPALRLLPLHQSGDTAWHVGWSQQLMDGDCFPTAAIPGDVPNYYPWLFHALLATIAPFVPGGRAYHALGPTQLLSVAGSVAAFVALGREVARPLLAGRARLAGAGAALVGAIAGGVGFVLVHGIDVVIQPAAKGGTNALRYRGDLLFTRSYNGAFGNLAPPFPRDLGYALLAAFLALLAVGLARARTGPLVGAGAVLGLAGLTTGEGFLLGMAIAALLAVFPPAGLRRRTVALATLFPALGLYALWAVPIAVFYVVLGGFLNTTVGAPISLPPEGVLVSWGLALPVGIYGAWRWLPRSAREPGPCVLAATLVAGAGLLGAATIVPAVFGQGFDTLGRLHRYWPLLYLGVAVSAGVGAADLVLRGRSVRRWLGVAVAAVLMAGTVPSAVIASLALPRKLAPRPDLPGALLGESGSLFAEVAALGRGACVVAAPPQETFALFSYTGYRFLAFQTGDPARHRGNRARIRWRDVYASGRAAPDRERLDANEALVEGTAGGAERQDLIDEFQVDAIVSRTPAGTLEVERTGDCG